jgi:energy-coupling factor transport system substrate-specific component
MRSTNNSNKRKSDSRHVWMLFITVILLIAAFTSSIVASTTFFKQTTRSYREEIIVKTSKLVAEQINGDKVNQWLDSGADDEYLKTSVLIQSICNNTPYVQYIYVYQIKPDGCHVVFDVETSADELVQYDEAPDISTDIIGDIVEFDEGFSDNIPTLLAGGNIDIIETDDKYGWLLTKYEPVFDSSGQCVAYVGVDISMIGVKDYYRNFAKWIIAISAVFLVMLIVVGYFFFAHERKVSENAEFERMTMHQKHLFEETALALANAIDAKDKYTHGHSIRVAEYSRRIAELSGKSKQECEEIYYAGLLHDVGKIGVPEEIITKEGKLTDEEYEAIKQHSAKGSEILKNITEYPYLSIGARYHHERYDGKGYPDKLVGTDIPDIARIIAVADSYDAMTSLRSYRKTIPQQKVREELISCAGTQFDPEYANVMIHMIDTDTDYIMKEKEINRPSIKDELVVGSHKDNVSLGLNVDEQLITVNLRVRPDKHGMTPKPSLLIFDSLDGRYHVIEKEIKDLIYYEYCELGFDGNAVNTGVRKIEVNTFKPSEDRPAAGFYRVEAVRMDDHTLIRIIGHEKAYEYIIALPDSSRYTYLGFTGEHCIISDMSMDRAAEGIDKSYIPRIAEKISYINVPEGDIPNIQVDRYRSSTSEPIPVEDGMTITFHTKSLPTARLVWHCPFCVIYSSDDGTVTGSNYVEYALIRLDGETWESGEAADNELIVTRDGFEGWDHWRELNRNGYDVAISFKRNDSRIVSLTENAGISIKNITTVNDKNAEIYVALSGDQCAITNIRIVR